MLSTIRVTDRHRVSAGSDRLPAALCRFAPNVRRCPPKSGCSGRDHQHSRDDHARVHSRGDERLLLACAGVVQRRDRRGPVARIARNLRLAGGGGSCTTRPRRWGGSCTTRPALRTTPGWNAAIPAALLLPASGCTSRVPAPEYVLGGRDPGVYVSEGIQIAHGNRSSRPIASQRRVPHRRAICFFRRTRIRTTQRSLHGFHLRNPETGTVTGQFPQVTPSGSRLRTDWMASRALAA